MKAISQEKPGGRLSIIDLPVPEPGPGEVLVKMIYSPINPSDLSFLQGTFSETSNYPVIPGIEGCGRVVESGSGIMSALRKGKRVACTASDNKSGTWAEYMVTSALKTIPLGRNISDEKGAMLLVNPLTAVAFIEIAKKNNHKTIVNNAAASSLGSMLNYLCRENNIILINIVARRSQEDYLKQSGADYVLNSDTVDFENKLADITEKLGCKLFFDAVGGEQAETFLRISPPGSTIVNYAKLSEQNIEYDPRVILQQDKTILGFFLGNYTSGNNLFKNLKNLNRVKKMLAGNMEMKISARYPCKSVNDAVEFYRNNMSAGKVLLSFENHRAQQWV